MEGIIYSQEHIFFNDDINKIIIEAPSWTENLSENLANMDIEMVRNILTSYYIIDLDQMIKTYSLPIFSRTGQIILNDGSIYKWEIRLGGTASVTDSSGNVIYLVANKPE